MKKLFLAAFLSVSMMAVSQKREHKGEHPLTLEQKTELRVKKMTLDLDLNTKQQQELKSLFLEEGKKMETKKASLKAKREKVEKLTADEKFAMKSNMLDKKIEMKAKLHKILTSEQMSKLEQTKKDRPKKMQKKERRMQGKK